MNAVLSFSESLVQIAVSNLVFAVPFGLLAWWLQTRGDRPFLAHLLWLLVLVKLVSPPFFSLPVEFLPAAAPAPMPLLDSQQAGAQFATIQDTPGSRAPAWNLVLVGIWLTGSAIVLAGSLLRAKRFNRLLRRTSRPTDRTTGEAALRIASRLGLARAPEVRTTVANVSPMVWWIGGRVRIYLPRTMIDRMDRVELDSILAHELGHVRRGDHFIRWLECAVCVLLWWNPFAWWARRNLRICEEICCDAFVLSKTEASCNAYAGALVSAMEVLAVPSVRPSGLASHVNGGFIERRIKMILSGKLLVETPRWLRGAVIVAAALVLPLGFSLAQNADDLERVQEWLDSGVNSAFLTEEQAAIMMSALRGAERRTEFHVVDDGGNHIVMKRQAIGDGNEVMLDLEFQGAGATDPVAFAERHLEDRVATGQLSRAEADRLLTELKTSIENGLPDGLGTMRVVSVDGAAVHVVARGPGVAVNIRDSASGDSTREVVEFSLEHEVDTVEQ